MSKKKSDYRRKGFILAVFAVILFFGFTEISSAAWVPKGPTGTYESNVIVSMDRGSTCKEGL